MIQQRSEDGKFAPKSEQFRQVRSIRLTDETWAVLGSLAEQRCITRADLLEEFVERGEFSKQPALNRDVLEGLIVEVLNDLQVTRNGKDKGAVKRALKALLERLS